MRLSRRGLLAGGGTAGVALLAACSGRRSTAGGGASAAVTPAAGGAAPQSSGPVQRGGTIQYRLAADYVSDPIEQTTVSAQQLAGYMYSRLLKFKTYPDLVKSANREIISDVAAKWEQPDQTTFIFHLDPNAVFHDKPPVSGRKVTAQDIVADFTKFTTDDKNANRNAFAPVDGAPVAIDDSTVQFKTKGPFAPFLVLIADAQNLWVIPKELTESNQLRLTTPIGSGPWVVNEYRSGSLWDFKAFDKYYGKDETGQRLPYTDSLHVNVIPEDAQNLAQILAQKVDISDATFDQLDQIKRQLPGMNVVNTVSTGLNYTSFQMRGGPFQDVRLRRAMSMAQDRNALLQAFSGGQGWWHNMLSIGMGEFYLDPHSSEMGAAAQWYNYSPKDAQQLIDAAGFTNTPFNFIYPTGINDVTTQRGVLVYDQITKSGFKGAKSVPQDLKTEFSAPGKTFFGNVYDGVFLGNEGGFADPYFTLYNMLHSQSARNHPGVKDPQLDKLIEQLGTEFDRPTRVKLAHQIQQYASDQMYYAPNAIGPTFVILQKWVANFPVSVSAAAATESYAFVWFKGKPA